MSEIDYSVQGMKPQSSISTGLSYDLVSSGPFSRTPCEETAPQTENGTVKYLEALSHYADNQELCLSSDKIALPAIFGIWTTVNSFSQFLHHLNLSHNTSVRSKQDWWQNYHFSNASEKPMPPKLLHPVAMWFRSFSKL